MRVSIKKYSLEQRTVALLLVALLALIPINIFIFSRYGKTITNTAVPSPTALTSTQNIPIVTLIPEKPEIDSSDEQELSASDRSAKNNIISQFSKKDSAGVLYESAEVRIDYVQSADVFQAEILSSDISSAKKSAEVWFYSHGISKKGMCTLPIHFYLNYEVKQQMKNVDTSFTPLPDGC